MQNTPGFCNDHLLQLGFIPGCVRPGAVVLNLVAVGGVGKRMFRAVELVEPVVVDSSSSELVASDGLSLTQ